MEQEQSEINKQKEKQNKYLGKSEINNIKKNYMKDVIQNFKLNF
jgi:hypothetical protein